MSKYLVSCDGCGMPTTTDNPFKFSCTNCGYELCTVEEAPIQKESTTTSKETLEILEGMKSGKYQF